MINVKILVSSDGALRGFNIEGHSNFDKKGQDIVCSAVSSVSYMVVNTMLDIMKVQAEITFREEGLLGLFISLKDIARCRDILLGFKMHLLGIEEQYPENITVNYMEV